jgi:hypothetical protein
MTHTQWRDDFTRLVPGRAQAYELEKDGWHLLMPFENVIGPGGLLTTVGDWLIWNDALARSTLAPGLTDSLTRRMRLTGGRDITYALGLVVDTYRGIPEVQHSGSTAGYSTFLARYPDRGNLSIAVLCNSADATPTAYVHQIADRLIADFPRTSVDTSRVDVNEFARYYGLYRNDRTHLMFEVDSTDAVRLRALPSGWYWTPNGPRWRFDPLANGVPAGLSIAFADGDTVHYTFVARDRWRPTASELRAFEGSYHSDEVGATYRVKVLGDSLTMSVRPGLVRTLTPIVKDVFGSSGPSVWFSRDRSGRVSAMHFSESRVWDLVFTPVK